MLPDRPDRERRLANTYADRGGQTGWERVEDYREIRRYCAQNPNDGSQAVATAMDMKRGRIRGWVDATSRPEPAHAIEVADQHGWLDYELSDRMGQRGPSPTRGCVAVGRCLVRRSPRGLPSVQAIPTPQSARRLTCSA